MVAVPRKWEDAPAGEDRVQRSEWAHQRLARTLPQREDTNHQRDLRYSIRDVGQLFKLLNIKPNPNKIEYYSRIIKTICTIRDSPEIVEDLINYFEFNKTFWKVESLVVHLSFTRITKFLENWRKCIDEDEYIVVSCRMALLYCFFYSGRDFTMTSTSRWSSSPNCQAIAHSSSSRSSSSRLCRWNQRSATRRSKLVMLPSWRLITSFTRFLSFTVWNSSRRRRRRSRGSWGCLSLWNDRCSVS